MRKINVWRKQLQNELFPDTVIIPAEGKTDAKSWNNHKQTGMVSRFARGEKLKSYREQVLLRKSLEIDRK